MKCAVCGATKSKGGFAAVHQTPKVEASVEVFPAMTVSVSNMVSGERIPLEVEWPLDAPRFPCTLDTFLSFLAEVFDWHKGRDMVFYANGIQLQGGDFLKSPVEDGACELQFLCEAREYKTRYMTHDFYGEASSSTAEVESTPASRRFFSKDPSVQTKGKGGKDVILCMRCHAAGARVPD